MGQNNGRLDKTSRKRIKEFLLFCGLKDLKRTCRGMKVLHITANYPTQAHPVFGIFVKEQVESLRNEGVGCDVFFSNGKEEGGMKAHRASIKRQR